MGPCRISKDFFMEKGANRIKIDVSNSAPDVTTKVGDIVFNSNPAVGLPIGWVCADVGIGLAWRSFGNVEP